MRIESNLPTLAALGLRLLSLAIFVCPLVASAEWQVVATDQGKRVEFDRDSIVAVADGSTIARGRIVLDKPIVDPKTSDYYRIIEVETRYHCNDRTLATIKRTYFKEEGELLRQESVRSPFDMPVRAGTPDFNLYRAACRPSYKDEEAISASQTAQRVDDVAEELRKWNEAQVTAAVQKDLKDIGRKMEKSVKAEKTNSPAKHAATPAAAAPVAMPMTAGHASPRAAKASPAPANVAWSYAGNGGPDHWGALKAEFSTCDSGRRQSPIDLRDGIAVDLEPIAFDYRPAAFRVNDSGRNLQLTVFGGGFSLLGEKYQLTRVQFRQPAEFTIDGNTYAMEAQFEHRASDGKLAIVSVLLAAGAENPVIQAALNNLPLERGGELMPPDQRVNLAQLLPDNRQYYTFMGSLTTPPCTENVLWLVLKQPQEVSLEQLAIFQRLYPANARPVQPAFGRIVKESR